MLNKFEYLLYLDNVAETFLESEASPLFLFSSDVCKVLLLNTAEMLCQAIDDMRVGPLIYGKLKLTQAGHRWTCCLYRLY